MVIAILQACVPLVLDTPTSGGQREAPMPLHDPIESPRRSSVKRFLRIFRLLAALASVIAALAVVLVARGDTSPFAHVHMLIATALGVGLTVLLGTGLMTLVFISSSSGHDDAAATFHQESETE
jgi:NAD/NADP transhydrogenase beta subunit